MVLSGESETKMSKSKLNGKSRVRGASVKPLVSVLMPAYNVEEYVLEAIESILNQTYEKFELIIIDDCSTDDTWQTIQKSMRKDNRIKADRNEMNLGRPETRNVLLDLISKQSKYYLWMDSDDVLADDCLMAKVNYLEGNETLSGVGSSIEYVDKNLNKLFVKKYPRTYEEIMKRVFISSPFSQGGFLLRKEVSKYRYNLEYLVCQDYELWFRLLDKGLKFENMDSVFYKYRQFEGQGKLEHLKLSIKNTIKIKSQYIFHLKYLSMHGVVRYFSESIMYLLPSKFVLWLFFKLSENNGES